MHEVRVGLALRGTSLPRLIVSAVEHSAVLAARAQFPTESLAALYDPATMPPALARAHAALDRAVDRCYRPQPFGTELQRLEFLFGLYQQLSAPVLGVVGKQRRSRID